MLELRNLESLKLLVLIHIVDVHTCVWVMFDLYKIVLLGQQIAYI